MTDTTYTDITVTQPILGFAPAIGYAVIAGIAIAAGTCATIATMLMRQKRRIAPTQKTLSLEASQNNRPVPRASYPLTLKP